MSTNVRVDLTDPAVQRLMGLPGAAAPERQLMHLAGDQDRGLASQVNLNTGKLETVVTYRDRVMVVDIYQIEGEPLQVHMICPRCQKPIRVTQDRKSIDFQLGTKHPHGALAQELGVPLVGLLSIDPFQCAWEIGQDAHVAGLVTGGATLCKWQVGIHNNVAKDA